MQISEAGKTFIKVRESLVLKPHFDAIGGVWDIGYGHVLKPGEPREPITRADADALFDIDILYYDEHVNQALTVELPSQFMHDACVSLCYNIGGRALRDSTVIAYCNAEQYLDAAIAFLTYRNARGKPIEGLLNRRAHEVLIFTRGEYD